MGRIKFTCFGQLEDVSERTKTDGTRYAVIKVNVGGRLHGASPTLMCFAPSIYKALMEMQNLFFTFHGAVIFKCGNTFLTVEEVLDDERERVFVQPEDPADGEINGISD